MRLKQIYLQGSDFIENPIERYLRHREIKKFKDSRRVAIFSKVNWVSFTNTGIVIP